MLCAFGHRVALCCNMLGVVGSNLKPLEGQMIATSQRNITQHCWLSICKLQAKRPQHLTQHIATLFSAICCTHLVTLLRRVATCCDLKIEQVRM